MPLHDKDKVPKPLNIICMTDRLAKTFHLRLHVPNGPENQFLCQQKTFTPSMTEPTFPLLKSDLRVSTSTRKLTSLFYLDQLIRVVWKAHFFHCHSDRNESYSLDLYSYKSQKDKNKHNLMFPVLKIYKPLMGTPMHTYTCCTH